MLNCINVLLNCYSIQCTWITLSYGANKVFNTLSADVLISSKRGAACICHNVEQQQISVHANVYFVLWICISIFHIRAQFYFSPDADAGSNEARQWPSLGRNPRAGELAKDEEMQEAECIHMQCTDSQIHSAHCTYSQIHVQCTDSVAASKTVLVKTLRNGGGMQIWGGHFRGMKFHQIQEAPEISHHQ